MINGFNNQLCRGFALRFFLALFLFLLFNQQIKNGFTIPKEEELQTVKIYLLYYKNLQMWIRYFGKENVIVRTYEEATPDVVADFCRTVGIKFYGSIEKIVNDVISENPRLSPRAIRVMRNAVEKKLDKGILEMLRVVLSNTSATIESDRWGQKYGVFSDEFHRQILSVYKEDTRRLAELYPCAAIYLVNKQNQNLNVQLQEDYAEPEWEEKVEMLLEQIMLRVPENDIHYFVSREAQ